MDESAQLPPDARSELASPAAPARPASLGARIVGWVGVALHAATFFWYAASGLLAPGWAVAVLLVLWAALLVLAIWLRRTRPLLTPLVAVLAMALWFAILSAGEAWLGWTG
jgi:hypothetical protein